MNIRFGSKVTRQAEIEGAGGGEAEATAGGKQAAASGDAGKVVAEVADGAIGDDVALRDGIGANSGKTEQEAIAELALTDEMRTKLLGALPEDARDRGAKWLKTRSSFADLLKAGLGADSKISDLSAALKGSVKPLAKDAKPEDVAAYRKAFGVPDAADKYAVYRPDGFEPTDSDTDAEKLYLEAMHAVHAPQAVVDAGLRAHYAVVAQTTRAQGERAAKAGEAAQEDLRAEYGRDYKANVTLADRWLAEHLGADMGEDWKGLMGMRFADGTALGEKPGFVKAIVRLAKASSDEGSLLMPGDMQDGTDVTAELSKMKKKMGTPEYNTKEFQDRLDRLIAIDIKRKAA